MKAITTVNPSLNPRGLSSVAQTRMPALADLVAMFPIPESLSEALSEKELADTIAAFVRQCRQPIRVRFARGRRLVVVLGTVVFEVAGDGRLLARKLASTPDAVFDLEPVDRAGFRLTGFSSDYACLLPGFHDLARAVRNRAGLDDHIADEFIYDVFFGVRDRVFQASYVAALEARVIAALGLCPESVGLAERLADEAFGSAHASIERYEFVRRHREDYLLIEREAPALLALMDHFADHATAQPGAEALARDPKQRLKQLLLNAGIRPALWRVLHRQTSSSVARLRIQSLLQTLGVGIEMAPRTLLAALTRVQAISASRWPCDVLLQAAFQAVTSRSPQEPFDDEQVPEHLDWTELDRVLPLVARLQQWFEQGEIVSPLPASDVVLCDLGLAGDHRWLPRHLWPDDHPWTEGWFREVGHAIYWALQNPSAWDEQRLRQWSLEDLRRRVAALPDREQQEYAQLPAWDTPYQVDLGLPDVQAVILSSPLDFMEESRWARHCVKDYWQQARDGLAVFISLRDTNPAKNQRKCADRPHRPLATLEISLDGRVSLRQVRTFANGYPSKRILALARQCAWQVRRQHWMRAHQTAQDESFSGGMRNTGCGAGQLRAA